MEDLDCHLLSIGKLTFVDYSEATWSEYLCLIVSKVHQMPRCKSHGHLFLGVFNKLIDGIHFNAQILSQGRAMRTSCSVIGWMLLRRDWLQFGLPDTFYVQNSYHNEHCTPLDDSHCKIWNNVVSGRIQELKVGMKSRNIGLLVATMVAPGETLIKVDDSEFGIW